MENVNLKIIDSLDHLKTNGYCWWIAKMNYVSEQLEPVGV